MVRRLSVRRGQATRESGASPACEPLREGVYEFTYWLGCGSLEVDKGRGLAFLKTGRVLGSDERGGVFFGCYRPLSSGGRHHVKVQLNLPPDAELVTGLRAGADGLALELECLIEPPAPRSLAVVDVQGVPVSIELVYIGAMPTP